MQHVSNRISSAGHSNRGFNGGCLTLPKLSRNQEGLRLRICHQSLDPILDPYA